jgi:hypothetical protein
VTCPLYPIVGQTQQAGKKAVAAAAVTIGSKREIEREIERETEREREREAVTTAFSSSMNAHAAAVSDGEGTGTHTAGGPSSGREGAFERL